MSLLHTAIGTIGIAGLSVLAIDFVLPSNELEPGIAVDKIEILTDGTSLYDLSVLIDGAHYTWSGQVFKANGRQHCGGGNTFLYEFKHTGVKKWSVDDLVGDDCAGLTADMTYRFTFVSVFGEHATVIYPPTGPGRVVNPETKPEG